MKKCEFCPYEAKYNLSRHIKLHHTVANDDDFVKCPHCDYKTRKNTNLKRHILTQHTDVKDITFFSCEMCEYKGKTKDLLNVHIKKTHEIGLIKFECDLCDKTCKTKGKLKEHKMINHQIDIVWHQCDLCDYKCISKPYLPSHKAAMHGIGKKDYPCKENGCLYVAHAPSHLKLHIDRMHKIIDKCLKCDYCDQKFKMQSDLRQHVRNVHEFKD